LDGAVDAPGEAEIRELALREDERLVAQVGVSILRGAAGAAFGADAWICLPAAKVRPALAASATSTTTATRGRKIGSLSPIQTSIRQNSAAAEEDDAL
jgi:hypothetical protein